MFTQTQYLPEKSLAQKWNISSKTLQRWRWLKTGPSYVKIGGRIRYSLDAIKEYEEKNMHLHSAPASSHSPANPMV